MNEVWNLDPIYKGFDDPAFETDLTALKEKVAAFAAFTDNLSAAVPAPVLLAAPALLPVPVLELPVAPQVSP